jgi:beta-lactamase class C
MKRSPAQRWSTLLRGLALTTCTSVVLAGGYRSRLLPLPATTACLEGAVTNGRANKTLSGIAVAVVLDGHIVYHRGFGTVSPTATRAVLPSTRFRIGSLTKALTATAVLSLVDDDQLRLHDRVTDVLPGFSLPAAEPTWLRSLTVHRLLSHQGGIRELDILDGPRDDGALAASFYDPGYTSNTPLMVAPGKFYNYSNANFALAGLVAETAAGRPYREVVRQRVFIPLGMTRAAFLPSVVTADEDVALGVERDIVFAPSDYDNAVDRPSGYAWASVDDLAQFMKFILRGNHAVLSPRLWRAMQTPQVNTFEFLDRRAYGYGLGIADWVVLPNSQNVQRFYDGVKLVWHEGAINGYQSLMMTMPRQQFGYVVLLNGDGHNLQPCFRVAAAETVGQRLPAPSPFPNADIQRDRFVEYVGHYTDLTGLDGTAVITLTPNGDLSISLPNLDGAGVPYDPILHPVSRDNFLLRIQDTDLPVTGFREHGNSVIWLRSRDTVMRRDAP